MENENRNPELEQELPEELNGPVEGQEQPEAEEKLPLKKRVLKELREWVVSIAVALLVVFLLKSFVFTIIKVDGDSMNDTLLDGQRLFVTVTDVKLSGADRGDVVICHYPNRTTEILGITTKTNFVKRVVAVEGDTVYRKDNATYVIHGDTGEVVDIDSKWAARYPGYDYEYTLGEDEYFVVGDNRGNSHDSRDWNDWVPSRDVGPITKDMLVGKVRFIIWPFEDIGSVK
ncbi:MAG: signal peptidase I [Clostridia bacterium]|nr:signal peptidase I [Clostridia bacterium]